MRWVLCRFAEPYRSFPADPLIWICPNVSLFSLFVAARGLIDRFQNRPSTRAAMTFRMRSAGPRSAAASSRAGVMTINSVMKTALIVLLAGCGVAAQAAACPEDAAWKPRLIEQLNALRASGGLCAGEGSFAPGEPVRWNPNLETVAVNQAAWMAQKGELVHQGPRGEGLGERVRQADYRLERVAENLAAGYFELEQVLTAWRNSSKHCRNMLDPRFTEVAVACVKASNGPWWAIAFGRPATATSTAARTAWFMLPSR